MSMQICGARVCPPRKSKPGTAKSAIFTRNIPVRPGQESPANKQAAHGITIPETVFRKRPVLFCFRIIFALMIIAAASACMLSHSLLLFFAGLLLQGAMYVHLIELQHSVLHLHAFTSHRMTRAVGFLLGLPMMISFSDFQYRHLRHHKHLGTQRNTETFDYKHFQLNSWGGFLQGMFDYSRWKTLVQRLIGAFMKQMLSDGRNPLMESRIRQEYRLFAAILVSVAVFSAVSRNPWPLLLWLGPLLAAEPVHFLLELPEHFGLPAHTNPDVFQNTRAWGGSWFARWYTHYTNFHVAHHFNQLIPMDNLPELQPLLDAHIPTGSRSKSYPHFFLEVIRGEVVPWAND